MYKFNKDPVVTYHQSPQRNPMKWQVLFREGDTFTPQSGQFQCKDYFNDVVAKYNNWKVIAYGFNNDKMQFNDEGVYVRLFNVTDREVLMHNIEAVINKEAPEPLTLEEVDGTLLMLIPRRYFNSTYLVSAITYVIRVCANTTKFKSFEEMMKSKERQSEYSCDTYGQQILDGWRFEVPEEYQKYWLYYNEEMNSEVGLEKLGHGTTIHNCGLNAWASGLSAEVRRNTEKEAA